MREAVLHLLADDPTLEPRDVIVMCPDIELFAPLVNATFGAASLSGTPELTGAAGRPLAPPDQPAAGGSRPPARPGRKQGDRFRRPRPCLS